MTARLGVMTRLSGAGLDDCAAETCKSLGIHDTLTPAVAHHSSKMQEGIMMLRVLHGWEEHVKHRAVTD
jgi:hypothetical protein